MNNAAPKRKLGQVLLDKGVITQDQLRIGLYELKTTNKPLGAVLIDLGFVTDSIVREALSENTGQRTVELAGAVLDAESIKIVPQDLARRFTVLPLSFDKTRRHLTLAMADTYNIVALDQIMAINGSDLSITPVLASESDIMRIIEQFYGFELSIDGILQEIETGELDIDSLQLSEDAYSHPMVRLINALLADAVQREASDIHFEPEEAFLRIRYRIDGVLRQVRSLHKSYWPAMAVRLKVISNMNIAESRAPQDGRISMSLVGRQIDFRSASQPTTWGENFVLRILDRKKGIVEMEKLGLSDDNLSLLRLMLARPEGIILVTGPTGSGKTTTLYSILNHINTEEVNIMTMEDPVEYPMAMIRQSSVNESVKMGFGEGIRSMMRQDPDVILVGEIRDHITAEMAFRAAMTGHQVFSTLHTNSAIGSIPRLLDIGILPDVIAGNLIGVVAQRLVRRLCPTCKEAYQPADLERQLLAIPADRPAPTIYRAKGCPSCEFQGYRGRTSVIEILKVSSDMDELIARRASMREMLNLAKSGGFRPIVEDGCRRVLDGTTSLEEISRVLDLTSRLGG
ncbi:MAG: secretion system protein E [Gammaproteobacteria bacterium]|nr:secretion system protein E [Gammaproteobacteria bacterium]MBJ53955.1 secretion system protein E [Gammaproteobacteria bacterium]HBN16089.1 secretion system protein E [Pseudohongiella sp.]